MIFALILVLFQNCGEVTLLGLNKVAAPQDAPQTPSEIPPEDDLLEIEYKAPPSDLPNPTEGTAENSWQRLADNECVPNSTNQSGYPNNNVMLSREKNPKDPNCNQFIRPPYELIKGCRVYDRDAVNAWSAQQNLLPWTMGLHYIVNNLPLVVHQPYETVSFKIRADELVEGAMEGYPTAIYRGAMQLYYDVHALVSVTTEPCVFKKDNLPGNFCQRNNTSDMFYVSKKSDPAFLALAEAHPEYRICQLEVADYYYVNIRFIDQANLQVPGSTTCTQAWCAYFFGFTRH